VLLLINHLDERESRREAGLREAAVINERIASSLENFARDIDSYIAAAALVLGSRPEAITHENTSGYLRTLAARYDNLSGLFITDLDGRVIAQASGEDTGFDVSSRPYLVALKSGERKIWTGGLTGLRSGELTSAHGRVINGPDGQAMGYLIVAFQPADILARLPAAFPEDANLALIDKNGRIVISVRQPDLPSRDVSDSPLLAEALTGGSITFESERTPFDADEDRYGSLQVVPTMQWLVGYTRSVSQLNAQITSKLLRDLGVLGLITVAAIAALILLAREMTRPLKSLAAAAADISEGRNVQIKLTGADPDVEKLERAFAGMVTAVNQRESRLQDQAYTLRTLEEAGATIASGLDFQEAVQAVTDVGTRLAEAEFGAFFHNVKDESGEAYQLYTLSGVDAAAFADYPMPRVMSVFGPTFRGESTLRFDDVTLDSRYGKNLPYDGTPQDHLPVRSYMAVPVMSRDGEVLGGLFFGHSGVGVFGEQQQRLVEGIASWASIALDNARLYTQAQKIQEDLRHSNEAKDEFLGLISHELRTPTTTIYGGLRILSSQKGLLREEQAHELIESMAEEGARLVRLIENLLAVARLELGRVIDTVPADINELVEESVVAFARQKPGRTVVRAFGESLPRVEVEPTYFQQILNNLLSNADKYSPQEAVIEVQTLVDAEEVVVVVSDSGPGVDDGEIDHIFDSFYRSDKTVSMASGHGLGLTVCRKLLEAQSGRIWAVNRAGGGLSVAFSLPCTEEPSPRDVVEPPAAQASV
jgi:signal transduction histidine kinase